jgi:hypothetical protein
MKYLTIFLLLLNLLASYLIIYRQGSLKNLICNTGAIGCGAGLTLGPDWFESNGP